MAITDEASAIEALGLSPRLVAGRRDNLKITHPEDLALAEQILAAQILPAQFFATSARRPTATRRTPTPTTLARNL